MQYLCLRKVDSDEALYFHPSITLGPISNSEREGMENVLEDHFIVWFLFTKEEGSYCFLPHPICLSSVFQ